MFTPSHVLRNSSHTCRALHSLSCQTHCPSPPSALCPPHGHRVRKALISKSLSAASSGADSSSSDVDKSPPTGQMPTEQEVTHSADSSMVGSSSLESNPLHKPVRPQRPNAPSAAAIQAANDGLAALSSVDDAASSSAVREQDGEVAPPSVLGGGNEGVQSKVQHVASLAPQAGTARRSKESGRRGGQGNGVRKSKDGGKGERKAEPRKKLPTIRTTDNRIVVKVSNETLASHLATSMFRILLRQERLVMLVVGLQPVYTACRALALVNVLMNQKKQQSVAFTPLWMESPARKTSLTPLQYQIHVSVVPSSEDVQQGEVSKVLDFGDEEGVGKGLKGLQEDRAHHVADVVVSAVSERDDAMVVAATHTEVITSFHALALCQRRLTTESAGISPLCTAYFEMVVTGNPEKNGLLFYTEPTVPVVPAEVQLPPTSPVATTPPIPAGKRPARSSRVQKIPAAAA